MAAIRELSKIGNEADLTNFVAENYEELQREFSDVHTDHLAVQNTFIAIYARDWMKPPCSPVARGLLIWFVALFERHNLWGSLNDICQRLNDGSSLYAMLRSIFLYKYITDTGQYIGRFEEICSLLEGVYIQEACDARTRTMCEDIMIEYLANGIAGAGFEPMRCSCNSMGNHAGVCTNARVRSLWDLRPDELAHEIWEAGTRVAESLFDAASSMLKLELKLEELVDAPRHQTCRAALLQCPAGLHDAKEQLWRTYPAAYAQTQTFVKQSLDSSVYTRFDEPEQCMRYLRQYMPLHMPQIEEAVRRTLEAHNEHGNPGDTSQIRILDIGAGPGTLYCVLAAMFGRQDEALRNCTFEYCPLDPSKVFLDFVRIICANVTHDRLKLGHQFNCSLDDMPEKDLRGIDWFFLGNVVTPMLASTPDVASVAHRIGHAFTASVAKTTLLTIAENSGTANFFQFCKALEEEGLSRICDEETGCDGSWISGCSFFVTRSANHQPWLRLACYRQT